MSALLGLEKLDSPSGLGKIAAGGLPDATSVQDNTRNPAGGNLQAAAEAGARALTGIGIEFGVPYAP